MPVPMGPQPMRTRISPAEMAGDFIDARGFVDVAGGARVQTFQEACVVRSGAGDHQHRDAGSGGFDLGDQFVAGTVGEGEVEHDQIEAAAEMLFCVEQSCGVGDFETFAREKILEIFGDGGFVFDEEDALFHLGCPPEIAEVIASTS